MKPLLAAIALTLAVAAPANARSVYLTFDDGPSRFTPGVLDVLDRYNAPATFFMCGRQVVKRPGIARRVARERHRIGNHSWDHQDFLALDYDDEVRELARAQQVIERATGVTPALMRPPFGHRDADTDAANEFLGLNMVRYDVSPRDWDHRSGVTTDQIVERTLAGIDAGGTVVLLHDSECRYPYLDFPKRTIAALPRIIRGLRARGHTLRRWPKDREFWPATDDPRQATA